MIICLFCAIEADDLSFMILCWIWFLLPPKLSPAFADGPSSWSRGSTVIIAEMVLATQSVEISWICLFVKCAFPPFPLTAPTFLFFLRFWTYN